MDGLRKKDMLDAAAALAAPVAPLTVLKAMAAYNAAKKNYYGNKGAFAVRCDIDTVYRRELFIVRFYGLSGGREHIGLKYTVFAYKDCASRYGELTRGGRNIAPRPYDTYDHVAKKWLTGRLWSVVDYGEYRADGFFYLSDADVAAGGVYFGVPGRESLRALEDWQLNYGSDSLRLRTERERANIDALMAHVPDLSGDKAFLRWIDSKVIPSARYCAYRREGDNIVGFCTHCGRAFTAPRADFKPASGTLHNKAGRCPVCGTKFWFWGEEAAGEMRKEWNRNTCAVIQRCPDGVMVSSYTVSRFFHQKGYEPEFGTAWEAVDVVSCGFRIHLCFNGRTSCYTKDDFNVKYDPGVKWRRTSDAYYFSARSIIDMVYPGGLKKAVSGTPWVYTGIEAAARGGQVVNVTEFLTVSAAHPGIEKLVKVGLWELAGEAVNGNAYINRDETKVTRVLGCCKDDLRLFRSVDVTLGEMLVYNFCRTNRVTFGEKELRRLAAARKTKLEYAGQECYVDIAHALALVRSWERLEKYLDGQTAKRNGDETREYMKVGWLSALGDLGDYHAELRELGEDMSDMRVLLPRELQEAHAGTAARCDVKKQAKYNEAIRGLNGTLNEKYGYCADGYMVRVASSADEIVREGMLMHHCVARYCEKMADGGCVIAFVRAVSEPEKPLCTVELNGSSVIQIRAKGNGKPDENVNKFFEKYKKEKLQCHTA